MNTSSSDIINADSMAGLEKSFKRASLSVDTSSDRTRASIDANALRRHSSNGELLENFTVQSLFSRKSSISPSDIRVLVVDNEESSRHLLMQYLRRANYQVEAHDDDTDIMAHFESIKTESNSYNLIIFSVSLRHISGPKLIENIRAHPFMQDIPVIVLASPQETELAYRSLKAGADDYLLKPIRMEVIKGVWQNVWRRRSEKKILRMLEDERRFRLEMEQKIGQLQDQVVLAIETPISLLTHAVAELMQDSTLSSQSKSILLTALNALTSSNLYKPMFEKALLDPSIDKETRLWISKELLGGQSIPASPLDIPLDWPPIDVVEGLSSPDSGSESRSHSRTRMNNEDSMFYLNPNNPTTSPKASASSALLSPSANGASRRLTTFVVPTALKAPSDSLYRASMPNARSLFQNESPDGRQYPVVLDEEHSYSFSSERVSLLYRWDFDLFQYTEDELVHFIIDMFHELGLVDYFNLPVDMLFRFLLDAKSHYHRENPYHNFRHSFDLTQGVFFFLQGSIHVFQKSEILGLLVACVCHDLDHPGKTNNFLISCESVLALRYNDQSVLENYHCYQTFILLRKKQNYFLHEQSRETLRDIRTVITRCILATDLALHVDMLAKFNTISANFDTNNKKHRLTLLEIIIKSADISNPLRPLNIAKYWSDIIQEEQFLQGDMERHLNLPITPFADRQNPQQARMSISFIDYMVAPLFDTAVTLVPSLRTVIPQLTITREYWVKVLETQTASSSTQVQPSSHS